MSETMNGVCAQIERLAEQASFNGIVSVETVGREPYCGVFGWRDFKEKLPVNPQTKFAIASGTKFFTALGIGKLVEQGLLSLDAPVKDLYSKLGEYIAPDATVRQLLGHTSGIYDYFDEETMDSCEEVSLSVPPCMLEGPVDYLPMFEGKQRKFSPGQRFSYSNGGYVFLALLIEIISGQLYRDYVTEQILNPAGMTDSGFFAFYDLPHNTARGYHVDCRTTNIYTVPVRGGGDGGMYTTCADLLAFWRALFSCKILPRELLDEFLTTHYAFDEVRGYGLGVYKQIDNSRFRIVGCDCGVGFYSCYLPSNQTIFSVISNITGGGEQIRKALESCLL